MRKSFSARTAGVYSVLLLLFIVYSSGSIFAQCPSTIISGSVYADADNDGQIDSGENYLSGILVRAFDADGNWVGQSLTNASGTYSIGDVIDGQPYRLEFLLDADQQVSSLGSDNAGDIQFTTAPNCSSNLGLTSLSGSCGEDTEIFLTCFVNGLGTNSPGQETILGITNSFNTSSPVTVYSTQNETGSIWGLAYREGYNELYSSAFVKQHASLGAGGIGAIYRTDISGTPSTSMFVDLTQLGQNVGNLSPANSANCNYGRQVGQIGLGGMSIDDTGSSLYVANLFTKSIVSVDLQNPTTANTQSFRVPDPGCNDGSYEIFAVTNLDGSIYVGVTCTGEASQNEANTSIHVYELNPSSGLFSLVFSDNYSYGFWSDDNISGLQTQQWLTDIDITEDGNMILALSDRLGHAFCNASTSRIDDQFGDILIASPSGNGWVLESNGQLPGVSGTGVGNGQGPGGGEFFGEDFFPANPTDHPEVVLGSIYVLPGSNEVVAAVFDPVFAAYSGGLHRYNTQTGVKVGSRELYNQNIAEYFGKATGFGNIVAACGTTAPQIGNYVWRDLDCDGIQDAGEQGIGGINVVLYNSNCEVISRTTTDDNGNYNFSTGIISGASYFVGLDVPNFNGNTEIFLIDNTAYTATVSGAGGRLDSDLQFVQGCNNLGPLVPVTISGNNQTSFDIGLKPSTNFDLALVKRSMTTNGIQVGDVIEFQIEVYNQGSVSAVSYDLIDYLTSAFQFDASLNTGWIADSNGNPRLSVSNQLNPGQSRTHSLFLRLNGFSDLDDLINRAEIATTLDSNGQVDSDVDSTADDIRGNDAGGIPDTSTDNQIDGDGAVDEDDEDAAIVNIFDLALNKVNRDIRAYDIGETVTFDITISNQGNVAANSFDVSDIYPQGLIFLQGQNPGWVATGPNMVTYTHTRSFESGDEITLPIRLLIADDAPLTELMNFAEISDFETSIPSIIDDFDSQPDTDITNDIGGTLNTSTDNMTDDNGVVDEDDHDPASVQIRAVDLALIKRVDRTSFNLGDEVTFIIEVHNQGTTDIRRIEIVDFLPANTFLRDDSWILSGGIASKEVAFLNPLRSGEVYTDQITLQIDPNASPGAFVNVAEISRVYDSQNVDVSGADIDSNPDAIIDNDAGGMPVTAMDDYLLGTGLDDEDDSDPALIFVPMIELTQSCVCLNNATQSNDGQFRNELKITSISGENWFIDNQFDFFSNSGSSPGAAMSIATGPTGEQFREVPNGDGTSCYFLLGRSLDDREFSLRATNGAGVFLQASGGQCEYNRPAVTGDGLDAVCANSTFTYSVDADDPAFANCVGFSWLLSAGAGTIVNLPGTNATGSGTAMTGSGTGPGNSITIEFGDNLGFHELTLFPHCPQGCVAPINLSIEIGSGDEAISCRHDINLSLGTDCMSEISAEDLLTSDILPGVAYQVLLTDEHNNVIPNNVITEDQLFTTLTAKVVNPCSGNSCWANINVEDKLAPRIQCDDVDVVCYLVDTYEPIVVDNCSTSEFRLIDEAITPVPCGGPYIQEVHRTYVAEDGFGNVSSPCTQQINVLAIPQDDIVIPPNFTTTNGNSLSCLGLVLNDEGFPDISVTGVPTINGIPLFPINDIYCNIGIDFRDFVVQDFGCSKKINRTWTIFDGCSDFVRRVQTIEIADTRAPWVTCPPDVTVSTDGSPGCDAPFTIPLPEIQDDCTTEGFGIDIRYAGGFLQDVNQPTTVTLNAADSTEITYQVYDNCGNLSSCTFNVTILDNVSPTAVCDRTSVVSLRLNGTAKAFPETFDDGSFDDCLLADLLVRRVDTRCDCERPQYDNMQYLGSRNGRYYYLSDSEYSCAQSFNFAKALGGSVLASESQEEHDWVFQQVNEYIPGISYFIGLQDKGNGIYSWENHLEPTFNSWAGGAPSGTGTCVVTNPDGEWMVFDGQRARYVLEISNPCTFSNEVPFCCEDVGEESIVILRAIDAFGGFNDCRVNVEVQDKVPPILRCPSDVVLECGTVIDVNNLSSFGNATASDSCLVIINEIIIDERSTCGTGTVVRLFEASDASGSSICEQRIVFNNSNPFDFSTIIVPEDFETGLGCNFGALAPENLPIENGYPRFTEGACDLLDSQFEDQVFSFAGPDSDACLKILRQWTVIDWCQTGPDGLPLSRVFDQTIQVNNTDGPVIQDGDCDSMTFISDECDTGDVQFSVTANDDCTPGTQLQNCLRIDLNSDGTVDLEDCLVSNVVSFNNKLPIGTHTAIISFSDLCGNTTTCSKEIIVGNDIDPVAICKTGLSVALEPWDLTGDGIPDDERACIFPFLLDLKSEHPCGNPITLSFCENDPTDKITFTCDDIGLNTVTLCVTDDFGNSASCRTTIDVQDNNDGDFCPEFDLALIKQIDFGTNSGPFEPGDNVDFRIIVFNQGNQDAYNIEVVDYIPEGFTLSDSEWTLNGGVATLNNPIPFIQANGTASVFIQLTIDDSFMGDCLVNRAEISNADDDNDPTTPSRADLDSTPDSDPDNDIVGGDNVLDNTANDEDDHDLTKVNVVQMYDLALTKTISPSTPGPYQQGSIVTYDITVTNEGTLDASTVYVSDNIPNGLILNDPNWNIVGGEAIIANSIPSIPAGTSQTVSITFMIDPTFMGSSILNDAQIIDPDGSDPEDIDSNTATDKNVDEDGDGDGDDDDEDWAMLAIGQNFDLALAKTISSSNSMPFLLGDNVVFDITVYNQGSIDATSVQVTDYVPSGLIFAQSAFNTNAGWSAGPNPTLTLGTVAVGTNQTVQIELQVDPNFTGTTIVNNAEITAANNDLGLADEDSTPGDNANTAPELNTDNDVTDAPDNPNDNDDFDPAEITVDRFDLALTKNLSSTTPGPFSQGSAVCFDLTVENQGSLVATTVQIEDQIPEGLILNDNNWIQNGSSAVLVNPIASIAVGATETVKITFTIDPGFMGNSILNDAQIIDPDNSDFFDVDSNTATDKTIDEDGDGDGDDDDEDWAMITIGQVFDLALTKTIATGQSAVFQTGDFVTFDVTVFNQGTIDATGVEITDYVPSDLIYVQAGANMMAGWGPGPDPSNLIGAIPAGGMVTVPIQLQISPSFTGALIVNDAEITAANNALGLPDEDSSPNDNSNTASEVATDDDVNDAPDNPNDSDDFDPASINVDCNLEPVCNVLSNITIQLDENGNATLTPEMIDNGSMATCDGLDVTLSLSQIAFDCSQKDVSTVVAVTVTDSQNNVTSGGNCSTTVTVQDNINPTIACQSPAPVLLDDAGVPVIDFNEVITSSGDNCTGTLQPLVIDLPAIVDICNPNTAMITLTDGCGNSASCTFEFSIVNDPPTAVCVDDFELCLDANGMASIDDSDINNGSSDFCGISGTAITPSNFTCADVGMNTVTLSVFDNSVVPQSDQCTTVVTVVDKTPPTAVCQDVTIEVNAVGNASIVPSDIDNGSSDVCGLDNNGFSLDQMMFDCESIGVTNQVVLTVTDINSNTATCNAIVTVLDNIAPTINCVGQRNVFLDENGLISIDADFIVSSFGDNCSGAVIDIDLDNFNCTDRSCPGAIDPISVTATVTDASGNTATCMTPVTVRDNIDPICTLLSGLSFNVVGDPPSVTLQLADILDTYDDNCANSPSNPIISPSVFDCSDLGDNMVTVTVDDGCNNTSTCSTTVNIQDVSVPTCITIPDVTLNLDTNGELTVEPGDISNGSTAGCDPNAMMVVEPNFFACNSISLNPHCVILTVTSANGNSATCKSNVTVQDVIPPSVNCRNNFQVSLDENGNASVDVDDIIVNSNDECGIAMEVLDISTFGCADKAGPVVVTATVTDMNGNSSTCETNVIVNDDLEPTCILATGLSFDLVGATPMITLTADQVLDQFIDNCDIDPFSSSIMPATFDCNSIGSQMVTVTVSDSCNNTSTCTTTVNIADTSVPTCLAQDITVCLDSMGVATIDPTMIDNGSNAGCGTNVILEVSPTDFGCSAIGMNDVVLTVTTTGGNSATCTAVVTIEDKIAPIITCPIDTTVTCDTPLTDLGIFGIATAVDNCPVNPNDIVEAFTTDLNACLLGTIMRTFTVSDGMNTVMCEQIVTLEQDPPFDANNIICPPSQVTLDGCIDLGNIFAGTPEINLPPVTCVSVTIDSTLTDLSPQTMGTCIDTFLKVWTILDACTDNIFTCEQTIILDDGEGPVITCSDVTAFLPSNASQCSLFVDLPVMVIDSCQMNPTGMNDSEFADDPNSANAAGTYPGGITDVTITASDPCGNVSSCSYTVTVLDTTASILTCDKIVVTIQPNMLGVVTVDQAAVVIESVCPDDAFSISFSNTSNNVTSFTVDCDDAANPQGMVPGGYTVYLYSGTSLIDSCNSLLQVLDGANHCSSPLLGSIAGHIYTEDDIMISDVMVEIEGVEGRDHMTEADGFYAFEDLRLGGFYKVSPTRNFDHKNGINTIDLIIIQRHILGLNIMDSPYKIIAADVNNDNQVNALDLIELRKLILGSYNQFPQSRSWRMVDAAHEFVDPQNPFVVRIPEEYTVRGLETDVNANFIGVKVGDVNGSAQESLQDGGDTAEANSNFIINIPGVEVEAGAVTEVVFKASDMEGVSGFQYSIKVDSELAEMLEFTPMLSGLSENHVNLDYIEDGYFHLSWIEQPGVELTGETELFSLLVRAKSDIETSDLFTLMEAGLAPQAYDNLEVQNVVIDAVTESDSEVLTLSQNVPNPWNNSTEIYYQLPEDSRVVFNLYNVNGKLIRTSEFDAPKGSNTIFLDKGDMPSGGIYFYEVITANASLKQKMMYIK